MIRMRSRRGEGQVLSTILAIPLFAMLIGYTAYFGRALYARAAIEEAAAAGARFAVTSLSGEHGCQQAQEAMQIVLEGYHLDPASAALVVQPLSGWGRGMRVEVTASYPVAALPSLFFSRMLGDPEVRARYEVVVDRYANRYSNGWQPCTTAQTPP